MLAQGSTARPGTGCPELGGLSRRGPWAAQGLPRGRRAPTRRLRWVLGRYRGPAQGSLCPGGRPRQPPTGADSEQGQGAPCSPSESQLLPVAFRCLFWACGRAALHGGTWSLAPSLLPREGSWSRLLLLGEGQLLSALRAGRGSWGPLGPEGSPLPSPTLLPEGCRISHGGLWGRGPQSGMWDPLEAGEGARWGLGPAAQEATGASPPWERRWGGAQPPGNTVVGGSRLVGATPLCTQSHVCLTGAVVLEALRSPQPRPTRPPSHPQIQPGKEPPPKLNGAAGGGQFLASWVAQGPVPCQLEAALGALPRAWLTDSSQHLPASHSEGRPLARAVSPPCH